jgi:ATP-dependent Clp protease ATP-binding subunit ClpA
MNLKELYYKVSLLEKELPKKVFGQEDAVRQFAEGYFSSELLADADKKRIGPRGVYLFTGPRGVGKAYLAELAAGVLGLPSGRYIMSGVADDLQCRILVGSSGHRHPKEGTLTGFVRMHPNCFIIFDSIAKTHPETLAVIREILDQGIVLDEYLDEEVSFRDCHIVFTSSADYSYAVNQIRGWSVAFKEPDGEVLARIISDELGKSFSLFEKEYGIRVEADEALVDFLGVANGVFRGSRLLRTDVDRFFHHEIYKLRSLIEGDGHCAAGDCSCIRFRIVEKENPAENEDPREVKVSLS